MSKSGQEFERRLDLAKYDLYEALKEAKECISPAGNAYEAGTLSVINKALAKVEKPYKEGGK